jgi:hypothetical protein
MSFRGGELQNELLIYNDHQSNEAEHVFSESDKTQQETTR